MMIRFVPRRWLVALMIGFTLLAIGCVRFDGFVPALAAQTADAPVLLFSIGVHIEPLGITAQGYHGGRGDYGNRPLFERHAQYLDELATVVERHGGKLTVQAQSPFTTSAIAFSNSILSDLEARGHEIALHFHEDAHLGQNPEQLSPDAWCAVMKEEIGYIYQAGVKTPVRYWSGGNLYPGLLEAASCAGLDVNADWKNPNTQQGSALLTGLSPWRPAGGPNPEDMMAFATHDPNGKIVFLPAGLFDRTDFASGRRQMSDEEYFDFMGRSLQTSLAAARPDRVNVFHFTVHPGEFDTALIERLLIDVVDPLVAQGRVQWATYSEMADAFSAWEQANPGVDPRSSETASAPPNESQSSCAGYMTFAINVHDFLHVGDSADTLLALTDLFEKYGVHGDFYFTAPMVQFYEEQRPDLIERLKNSQMTISYHVRPPFPTYVGFDGRLLGLSPGELTQTLRDYETYRLDMTTGDLLRDQPGGYSYVAKTFGRAPVVAGVANARWRGAGLPILAEMGAQMAVVYHETGTKPEQPFERINGLLIRPSDFSVTRWSVPGGPQDAFWWNELDTPLADQYDPVQRLQQLLSAWQGNRPPFVTALIHENNFYRRGGTPWTFVYYEDRQKTRPKSPPYDLNAPDASRPRSAENKAQILAAYEALVKYAAEHLCVVTSEDIVGMAEAAGR